MTTIVRQTVFIVLLAIIGLGSGTVLAGERGARGWRAAVEQRREERMQQRETQQQRSAAGQGAGGAEHPGRLTPEERRALRRQIHEAGREIYPPNPPPRR